MTPPSSTCPDVVLVGAGIMSATLGVLLKEMIPSHGESLISNAPLHDRITSWTRNTLGLREEAAVLS